MWGASLEMVAGAVPHAAGDSGMTWLQAPNLGSPLDPDDLEIRWALESHAVGRHELARR